MTKQELQKKIRNLVSLQRRGYLDSKQVVRLGREYRLRYERTI